jgi:hypothetical protein
VKHLRYRRGRLETASVSNRRAAGPGALHEEVDVKILAERRGMRHEAGAMPADGLEARRLRVPVSTPPELDAQSWLAANRGGGELGAA